MLLEFDAQGLEKAISSFHDAMGVTISILYEDYSLLGSKKLNNPYCRLVQSNKKGLTRCMDSNCMLLEKCKKSKRTEINVCHAGLIEVATPILYGDEVIGYVSFGHIKPSDIATDSSKLISDLPVEPSEAAELYNALPDFEGVKITAIIDMAEMFVKYIMAQRLIKPKGDETFEAIKQYVLDNCDKKMTSNTIANGIHVSKTALYNSVKKHTGGTVNEYINTVKIEKSKTMLLETDMSIETISEKLGFSSSAYYSILFKKLTGSSPSVFRREGS